MKRILFIFIMFFCVLGLNAQPERANVPQKSKTTNPTNGMEYDIPEDGCDFVMIPPKETGTHRTLLSGQNRSIYMFRTKFRVLHRERTEHIGQHIFHSL